MNAPVFKPDFLEQFMNGFDTNLKGYGTDVWFSRKCVNNCKIFVSDTTCVTNQKQGQMGHERSSRLNLKRESSYWRSLEKFTIHGYLHLHFPVHQHCSRGRQQCEI